MTEDGFASRWSRRKALAREGVALDEPVAAPASAAPAASAAVVAAAEPATVAAPPEPEPTLADVAALKPDSDYARFVRANVTPEVKNAALKKLFTDPHFNVMDGLDTYIADYSKPDPLPASMLLKMAHMAYLGLPSNEEREARAAAEASAQTQASTDGAAPVALASCTETASDAIEPTPTAMPTSAPATDPHENLDLRLQPDDAAGPAGPGPGPGGDAGRER